MFGIDSLQRQTMTMLDRLPLSRQQLCTLLVVSVGATWWLEGSLHGGLNLTVILAIFMTGLMLIWMYAQRVVAIRSRAGYVVLATAGSLLAISIYQAATSVILSLALILTMLLLVAVRSLSADARPIHENRSTSPPDEPGLVAGPQPRTFLAPQVFRKQ